LVDFCKFDDEKNNLVDSLDTFKNYSNSSTFNLLSTNIIIFTFKKKLKTNINHYYKVLEEFQYENNEKYSGGNNFEKAYDYIINLFLNIVNSKIKYYSIDNTCDTSEVNDLFNLILFENF
jgi:ribosome biogenesis GTPase A